MLPALRAIAAEAEVSAEHADTARSVVPAAAALPDCQPAARFDALVGALVRATCDARDHAAELRLARLWLVSTEERAADARLAAWRAVLTALDHAATGASARVAALAAIRDQALAADADLRDRLAEEGASPAAIRAALDGIAGVLLRIADELDEPPGPVAADLARRRRARGVRASAPLSFLERNRAGIEELWRREAAAWYAARHVDRHGVPPPDGWWIADPSEAAGGHLAPDHADLFDVADHAAFYDEMEARFRTEQGLPARGGGWVSQASLARAVAAALPGAEVLSEARPAWAGSQRLDIHVPALDLVVEYQGEQHFLPLEHWGGEAGLAARRELDERKRDACARAGVRLVEWRYDQPISVGAVRARLLAAGVPVPAAPADQPP